MHSLPDVEGSVQLISQTCHRSDQASTYTLGNSRRVSTAHILVSKILGERKRTVLAINHSAKVLHIPDIIESRPCRGADLIEHFLAETLHDLWVCSEEVNHERHR